MTPFAFDRGVAQIDLILNLSESGSTVSGGLEYNCDSFDAGSIARMAFGFQHLLEAAVADPDAPLSTLRAALVKAEKEQQLRRGAASTRSLAALCSQAGGCLFP